MPSPTELIVLFIEISIKNILQLLLLTLLLLKFNPSKREELQK